MTITLLAAHERVLGKNVSDDEHQWHHKMLEGQKRFRQELEESEHPGCQLAGHLYVQENILDFQKKFVILLICS